MIKLDINKVMKGSPPPPEYQVTLKNWRKYPYNIWSFVNIQSLIPTSRIESDPKQKINLKKKLLNLNELKIIHNNSEKILNEILIDCHTDSLLVMHKGILVFEYFNNFTKCDTPHIIFSISKSLTSLLTGILIDKKIININSLVSKILPETIGSAYENATIRNILDMNIASNFIEDYCGEAEIFKRYRSSTGWDVFSSENDNTFEGLHNFLSKMPKSSGEHGKKYHYCSPHSDLLGWIIERSSGEKFSKIISELLFKPSGINYESNVTVDKFGAPRSAGGISISPYDLILVSELVRNNGYNINGQIIPEEWIKDIKEFKDNSCYLKQDDLKRFPNGNYRSKWYQTGFEDGEFCAIGIHGQNIWINPKKELTIIRLSSSNEPIDINTEELMFSVFRDIGNVLS
ncbi:beta-lactamase family protein [bacterium]|nr:beta-lactamase family protein [bacterium]